MKKPKYLPQRVFEHGRWYCYVTASGKRRIWTPLSLIADGLPAMYAALSRLTAVSSDTIPHLVADWLTTEHHLGHAENTRKDEKRMCNLISDAFAEFRAIDVTAADIDEYLRQYASKARTFNAHRSMLRELMRHAIVKGHRTDNPVSHIKTAKTRPVQRYVTDSELRRIKVGAIYGDDGKRTRSGIMIALLLDLLYLTGQRVSDVLDLRWERDSADPDAPHVCQDGLRFRPSKTRRKTGAQVLIEWTPALRTAVSRIKQLQAQRLLKRRAEQRVVSGWLITGQDGKPLSYWGAASAIKRACKRANITGVSLHRIRSKALTDIDAKHGMQAARRMGAHSTEQQTADYIAHHKPTRVKATK